MFSSILGNSPSWPIRRVELFGYFFNNGLILQKVISGRIVTDFYMVAMPITSLFYSNNNLLLIAIYVVLDFRCYFLIISPH